jgi:hypothetical protein
MNSHAFRETRPCNEAATMDLLPDETVRADPWLVYRLLGSYAFAAT